MCPVCWYSSSGEAARAEPARARAATAEQMISLRFIDY